MRIVKVAALVAAFTVLFAPVATADVIETVNARLAADSAQVRLGVVEALGHDNAGLTLFAANVGNKQLAHHFVRFDPDRGGFGDISWAVDGTEGTTASGLGLADTTSAINRAMNTWQDAACSYLPLTFLGVAPFDLGYIQWAVGLGGVRGWVADLTHAGWLPAAFFDAIAPNGSQSILGVTFTLLWVDANGDFVDQDRDGKLDVAFREIYYNDRFAWRTNGGHVDVESVALHEAGHGLSQAHFGMIARNPSGSLVIAPTAVMNAGYTQVQRSLTGTDLGGHCSIWANW